MEYQIFNKRVVENNKEINIGEKALLILDYLLKYRGFYVTSKNLEKGVYPANTNSKNGVIRFHKIDNIQTKQLIHKI